MTLEEFLKQTNPEEYDFKKEMVFYYKDLVNRIGELPYRDNEDSADFIAEFDRYRNADNELKGEVKLFDCDSSNDTCQLTTRIYKTLWDYGKGSKQKNWKWEDRWRNAFQSFGGDTMNSFTTTRKVWENTKEGNKALYPMMNCFAKLTHTLGNFVLVPYGFNRARYIPTNDYWDASLKHLKEKGYETKAGLVFKRENFKQYVNCFFLWDYCDAGNDYEPTPLFGTLLNTPRKPRGNEEIREFLKKVIFNIKRRGAFMVAMLRIATNFPDDYKKIMEYLCKPETSICSCEAACEQLTGIGLSKDAIGIISGTAKEIKAVNLCPLPCYTEPDGAKR